MATPRDHGEARDIQTHGRNAIRKMAFKRRTVLIDAHLRTLVKDEKERGGERDTNC